MGIDSTEYGRWIGLTLANGFRVVEFLGSGAHNAVFKIAKGSEQQVIKLPRSHIGFAIGLPPDQI